jgi:DNA polymerase-1
MPTPPLLLVVDGNSLLHRAYHAAAAEGFVDQLGRPVWALRGLIGFIARAAARLRPDGVLVGFDCPVDSVRKVEYPGYKAHRAEKAADLAEQILAAPELIRAAGLTVVVPSAYEADDVLASSAAYAAEQGWRSVVMTSDRDAFALIDQTTSVLRIRNGGMDEAVLVTAEALLEVYGVHPWQYGEYAALRGDPSDNLRGVRGFGSATAARLLSVFGTVDAAWEALDGGDAEAVRAVVGEQACQQLATPAMREVFLRNRSLMRMRTDLVLPALDSVRLPVDRLAMRRALSGRGINLGPSLWALTGGSPPLSEADLVAMPRPWIWRRSSRARRDPAPGQLALF